MKQHQKPARLYKYATAARLDDLLQGRVRFTQAEGLNDPFELMPVFDAVNVSDDLLDEWASQPMLVENGLAKAYEQLTDEERALLHLYLW